MHLCFNRNCWFLIFRKSLNIENMWGAPLLYSRTMHLWLDRKMFYGIDATTIQNWNSCKVVRCFIPALCVLVQHTIVLYMIFAKQTFKIERCKVLRCFIPAQSILWCNRKWCWLQDCCKYHSTWNNCKVLRCFIPHYALLVQQKIWLLQDPCKDH